MTTTRYLWNPINQNIIREYDGAGNTVASYTTEPDLYGDVVSQHRSGQDSYYHTDGQGSTLALTDANGDVTDTYAYSAFGEVTEHTGSTVNPFQYIGQKQYYRDVETGDYSVRRRDMMALSARWLSIDPLQPTMSEIHSSSYIYSRNSPLRWIDVSGEIAVGIQRVFRYRSNSCKNAGNYTATLTQSGGPISYPEPGAMALYRIYLDRPAPCDGSLIAKAITTCSIEKCIGGECPELLPSTYTYYEALGGLKKGQIFTIPNLRHKDKVTDIAIQTFNDCTGGQYNQDLEVRFYCKTGLMGLDDAVNYDIGHPLQYPFLPSWKQHRRHGDDRCGINLPNASYPTGSRPPFWKDPNNSGFSQARRSFSVNHKCCGGDGSIEASSVESDSVLVVEPPR